LDSILNDPKKITEIHNSWLKGETHPEEDLLLNLGAEDNLGYNYEFVSLDVSKAGELYIDDGSEDTLSYVP